MPKLWKEAEMETIETKVTGPKFLQTCAPRYVLRLVGYGLFMYDTQEDIYIPAEVYSEITGRRAMEGRRW